MLIGVVLTCTAFGKPIWRIYDANQESPEDVLVDRNFANPPPWRAIGPYDVSFSEEDERRMILTVIKEAVANDPNESVDLDDPRTWFPEDLMPGGPDWIQEYLG